MNNLQLENKLSSREVAPMFPMQHKDLLKKIDRISKDFTESKISLSKYWTESSYVDASGKSNREFQITKRGCEFLAHKTTGTKGNLFTDRYMDKFTAMENVISNPNGIINQLSQQLADMSLRIQGLEKMLSKGKRHKSKINEALEQRLEFITEDKINQILVNSLTKGLLRVTDEGNVVDKDVLFAEANKLDISKHDIKVKLKLLKKIIYKQVRINGQNMWCIVVKR